MRAWTWALVLVLAWGGFAAADTGVLTPYIGSQEQPADSLSLDHMEIHLRVDHGMTHVEILHVYQSHASRMLEGRFRMVIPEQADIDGFAVWDDLTRIPGVIMEKAEARRLFEEIVRRQIDPGLMETGDEPTVVNEFTARVAPIAPYGGKRLEMSYRWPTPIERGMLDIVLPLRPGAGGAQRVGRLVIDIEIEELDDLPIESVAFHGAELRPEIFKRGENSFTAHYEGTDVELSEDLSFTVELKMPDTSLNVIAYRDVEHVDWSINPGSGGHFRDAEGYYLARVLFAPRESKAVGRRNVLFVVDGSLSMLGDKLQRTVEMIQTLTAQLAPGDRIAMLYANTETRRDSGPPTAADAATRAKLDDFLRNQNLAGGLDLGATLTRAGELLPAEGENIVVLFSDGHPTAGLLRYHDIVQAVKASPLTERGARLFAVGVGNDANRTLLTDLAAAVDGHYTWCADTADAQALAETVAGRMSAMVMRDIQVSFGDADNLLDSYPERPPATFAGSETAIVGRYRRPGSDTVTLQYRPEDGPPVTRTFVVELPEKDTAHDGIRRRWAKARVDFLLGLIRRDGEKREWVDEIIALSKRFTFVTPYTSFIAAPRALLRPRVIRPGDPILRVQTDQPVAGVSAVFPWGVVAPLTYLPDEDVWQVRFLAPAGFPDGAYDCQLVLSDYQGRQFVEPKSFVLDGKAPIVKRAGSWRLVAGGNARIAVYADSDTRTLAARLPFSAATSLRWDGEAKANVGYLDIPAGAPPGPTVLEIYAEDTAHNVSRTAIDVEVIHE
ncbi:MAG: VIT domain-containing protein [Candidatus Lernaella stagnicola]|nr:VIT domain-containing protein [Candidatus Lernaella stagnicola]